MLNHGFRILKNIANIIARRNGIHLGQQLTLSRDFGGQLKSDGGETYLFHHHLTREGAAGLTYADLP